MQQICVNQEHQFCQNCVQWATQALLQLLSTWSSNLINDCLPINLSLFHNARYQPRRPQRCVFKIEIHNLFCEWHEIKQSCPSNFGLPITKIFPSQVLHLDISPLLDVWPHPGDAGADGAGAQPEGGEADDAGEHQVQQRPGVRVHRLSHDDRAEEDAEAGAPRHQWRLLAVHLI